MPGNEMIHIQEGYLRLHFNISKQQHVIFTLKPLFPGTKAFDPGLKKVRPPPDWLEGFAACLTPSASEDDPSLAL